MNIKVRLLVAAVIINEKIMVVWHSRQAQTVRDIFMIPFDILGIYAEFVSIFHRIMVKGSFDPPKAPRPTAADIEAVS